MKTDVKENKEAEIAARKEFKEMVREYDLETTFQFNKNNCYVAFAATIKRLKGYDLTEDETEIYAIMKVQPKVRKEFKKAVGMYIAEHPDVVDQIVNMDDVKAKNYKEIIDEFFDEATDYADDVSEPNILEKIVYTPIVGVMDFLYDHF